LICSAGENFAERMMALAATRRVGGWGRNHTDVGTAVGGKRGNLDSTELDHEPTDLHPCSLPFLSHTLFPFFQPSLPAELDDMI
jgi:hypothetical protein